MKTNRLFIAVLVLFLVGCKTTKQSAIIETEVQTEMNTDVEVETDSSININTSEVVETNNEQTDSVITNEIVVELSKPDSSGSQYPEKITYKESTHVRHNKKETNRVRDSTSQQRLVSILKDKSDLKSDILKKEKIKEKTKYKMPGAISWVIILFALGILIFVYLILKRFKLV